MGKSRTRESLKQTKTPVILVFTGLIGSGMIENSFVAGKNFIFSGTNGRTCERPNFIYTPASFYGRKQ